MPTKTAWWERFHQQVLIPHADDLIKIWRTPDGDTTRIACAVFECLETDVPQMLGWDGKSPVFEIVPKEVETFSRALQDATPGDPAIQWFRTPRFGRVFLFVHSGTLCFNYEKGRGLVIAPGTQDHEWLAD